MDRPEPRVVFQCANCGEDVVEGEIYFTIERTDLHSLAESRCSRCWPTWEQMMVGRTDEVDCEIKIRIAER